MISRTLLITPMPPSWIRTAESDNEDALNNIKRWGVSQHAIRVLGSMTDYQGIYDQLIMNHNLIVVQYPMRSAPPKEADLIIRQTHMLGFDKFAFTDCVAVDNDEGEEWLDGLTFPSLAMKLLGQDAFRFISNALRFSHGTEHRFPTALRFIRTNRPNLDGPLTNAIKRANSSSWMSRRSTSAEMRKSGSTSYVSSEWTMGTMEESDMTTVPIANNTKIFAYDSPPLDYPGFISVEVPKKRTAWGKPFDHNDIIRGMRSILRIYSAKVHPLPECAVRKMTIHAIFASGWKQNCFWYNSFGVQADRKHVRWKGPYFLANTKEVDAKTGGLVKVNNQPWRAYESFRSSIDEHLKRMSSGAYEQNKCFELLMSNSSTDEQFFGALKKGGYFTATWEEAIKTLKSIGKRYDQCRDA